VNLNSYSTDRRERTRQRLLAAARSEFAQRGFDATAVADITAAADLGTGTFYLHFEDKKALLHEIIDNGLAAIREGVERIVRDVPPGARLTAAVGAFLARAYAQRELFTVLFLRGNIEVLARARSSVGEGIQAILEAEASAGIELAMDPRLAGRMIGGILNQAALWWSDHDEPGPDEVIEQVLRLLRSGLPAPLFEGMPGR